MSFEWINESKDLAKPKYTKAEENLISQVYTGVVEKTFRESSYYPETFENPYNPDDLYTKEGDYTLYEEMLKDDQVSIALKIKKDLILGSGWEIVNEDESQEEIANDLYVSLAEDPEVDFSEMIEEILSAYEFGFSITEKIFKKRDDGSLSLKILKTRHPNTWLIHQDKKGNIEKIEQRGVDKPAFEVDPKSVIHYVNNRKFQNPYGTSDLLPAYAAWFAKRQIIRYYAIFLEKAASPTPIAKYEPNSPQNVVDNIHNAIKRFQAKTAMTIPKSFEVDFLETSSNGEAYHKAINIFNMFIGRSLFIPDLLGLSGSETAGGSFALGQEQFDLIYRHIDRRKKTLERIINHELVRPIVFYNHGIIDNYPKFRFKPIKDENINEFIKLWIESQKGKIYKASDEEVNYFRELVGFPVGDVERPEPAPSPFGNPNEDGLGDSQPEQGEELPDSEADEQDIEPKEGKKNFARAYKNPEGDFYKRVDFKALDDSLNAGEKKLIASLTPTVNEIFEDLFNQIEKKKILQNNRADRIGTIELKKKSTLKMILKKHLRENFVDHKKIANTEIIKSEFKEIIPSDKFLEVLEVENFNYVGDWEYAVTKGARIELINAIKNGTPLPEVVTILGEKTKRDAMVSLERYARTKFTETMNRGRLEAFNESGVVSGYQYSAILDDRTTDICRGLHGKFFKAGNEPIPPMHFNCRSTLIPITKYEQFKPTEKIGNKPVDTFIKDNKHTGFDKQ